MNFTFFCVLILLAISKSSNSISNKILQANPAFNPQQREESLISQRKGRYYIILNAVGTIESNSRSAAIIKALDFLESMRGQLLFPSLHINVILWMYRDGFFKLEENSKNHLQNMSAVSIRFYSNNSLEDYNIGRNKKEHEYITAILESLSSESFTVDSKAVLITFSQDVKMAPLKEFVNIFKQIGRDPSAAVIGSSQSSELCQVKLLGKTKRMTSVSDWHDLMVAAFFIGDPAVKEWLLLVKHLFYRHAAGRLAATLFDPRPALLEASLQLRKTVRVGYFRSGEICAHKPGSDTSRCKEKALIEVECTGTDKVENHVCSSVTEPHSWKHTVSSELSSLENRYLMWGRDLIQSAEYGSLRLLMGAKNGKPAPFCWQNK